MSKPSPEQEVVYYSHLKERLNRDQINEVAAGKLDYFLYDRKYALGVAEVRGRRRTQEDTVHYKTLPELSLLTPEQQNTVFQKTIDELQDNIVKNKLTGGSCLMTCILCPLPDKTGYELITINLGDSETLIATCDREKNQCIINRVNSLHHPLDESPERQKEMVIRFNRIGGDLAVSRALGDTRFETAGLSHKAEILHRVIKGDELKKEIHLFVVCDGIRENKNMTAEKFDYAIRKLGDKPELLAAEIVNAAYKSGSGDNLSVITTRISQRDRPLDAPLALSVYDGHGDEKVAQLARVYFLDQLARNIQAEVKKTIVKMDEKSPNGLPQWCIAQKILHPFSWMSPSKAPPDNVVNEHRATNLVK